MEKDVLVSIQGLQFAAEEVQEASTDEELDKIETICPGQYYFKNNTHFVLYEELLEGFDEPVKNMMKIRENEFILNKKGAINVQMVFTEDKKTMTDYNTPFGNILIAIDTQQIRITETPECIEVHIEYGLEANYQFIADCSITIKIKTKTQTT